MPSAPAVPGSATRLLRALAVAGAALALPLSVAAPASAGTDPLAGRTITGQLVQAYPESHGADAPAEAPLSWVQPATGAPVRLDTADLADVPAGATVRVTVGKAVDDGADGVGTARDVTRSVVLGTDPTAGPAADTPSDTTTADTTPSTTSSDTTTSSTSADPSSTGSSSGSSSTQPTTTAVGSAAGLTDRVAVVLVEAGGGAPDAMTAEDLTATVDGPVHDFWSAQTGGAVDLGVTTTTSWVATTAGCDTPTDLWNQAAAAAGFTDGPGNHLLVYISGRSRTFADCSYGLAEIGSGLGSGGRLYVEDRLPSLIAHELGHNFGLGHSSGRQCDAAVDTGTCRTEGYRDYYDVMGASWEQLGTLNAAQEARLGVLPAAQRAVLDASGPGGTVTLAPLSGRAGVRALELTAADGTDYWLEYRSATGQDAWLGTSDNQGLQAGVLLHRSGGLPDTSLLLDGTPSAAAGWDADLREALPVGTPVALADGLSVTVDSLASGSASITVGTSPAPAASAAPAAAASPAALPGHGCRSARACTATDHAGAAPGPAGQVYTYAIGPASAAVARTPEPRVSLAAAHSPTALTALVALAGCLSLLVTTVVARGRLRAPARRR